MFNEQKNQDIRLKGREKEGSMSFLINWGGEEEKKPPDVRERTAFQKRASCCTRAAVIREDHAALALATTKEPCQGGSLFAKKKKKGKRPGSRRYAQRCGPSRTEDKKETKARDKKKPIFPLRRTSYESLPTASSDGFWQR